MKQPVFEITHAAKSEIIMHFLLALHANKASIPFCHSLATPWSTKKIKLHLASLAKNASCWFKGYFFCFYTLMILTGVVRQSKNSNRNRYANVDMTKYFKAHTWMIEYMAQRVLYVVIPYSLDIYELLNRASSWIVLFQKLEIVK